MELDIKEQTEKVQVELGEIGAKVQQADVQINNLTQTKSDLLKEVLKKQGFLEGLQSLDKGK